jgi:hypothetical protein
MANIDTNIAMGFRPIQIESPVNQMAALSQLQGLQQQQQMNALKMQEYQQQVQDKNELARIMGDPNIEYGSENFMRQVLARAPSKYEEIATRVAQREDIKERTAKREYETEKLKAENKQKQLEEFKTAQKDIAAFDSIEAVKADLDRKVGSGLLPVDMAANILAGLPQDNAQFPEWKKRTLTSLLTAEKQLEFAMPKVEKVDIGGAIKFIDVNPNSPTYNQEVGPKSITKTAAPVAPSKVVQLQGELDSAQKTFGVDSPQAKQIRNEIEQETGGLERQRIGQDAKRLQLEARRVDIDQKRQTLAEQNAKRDADPAFQQRMAAARATGEATAKDEVKARQTLPGVILRGEEGVRLIDSLVGKAPVKDKNGKVVEKGTAPHPGFETAVGATWLPGSRFVPGTDAADFQARFEQLKGASFLEAFETLKGGGAITNIEGEKGTAAINRMALAQSEKEFVDAARDVQRIMNAGIKRARSRASMPQSGTSTAPPTGYVLDK